MTIQIQNVDKAGEDFPPENDCIQTPEQVAKEVNDYFKEQQEAEQVSLLIAWEIGVRLNRIRETLRATKQGAWGKFLDEHFPDICRMTVWRYRAIASFFNSVLEFDGMTISEAYRLMKLAKFKVEGDEGEQKEPGKPKQKDKPVVALFKKIAKASRSFDYPKSLEVSERNDVRRGLKELIRVVEALDKPAEKVIDVKTTVVNY